MHLKRIICLLTAMATAGSVRAQTNFIVSGSEYAIAGSLAGDQVFPSASVTPSGGYLVWQDNITDGDGWGISALRLDSTFSGQFSTFRVNQNGAGDQEQPQVAMLKN